MGSKWAIGAYGTYDQGGNVWEWNETIVSDSSRGLRGGSFGGYGYNLHAAYRINNNPANEYDVIGFRVAEVPECKSDFDWDDDVDLDDFALFATGPDNFSYYAIFQIAFTGAQ